MRPRIIDGLNSFFHTDIFQWIIPDPAVVYAIMLTVLIVIFLKRCKSDSLTGYHATGIVIWGSISAMIGARVFYLLQNIPIVSRDPGMLLQINGATVSFGAYLGCIFGILIYSAINKLQILPYLDVAASVAGIGPMIGRIACFLNGDDYGKLSNLPWAVRFPHGSQPFIDQVNKGLINPASDLSLAVHPVQLYCSVKGILLFVLFTFLWKKKYFREGVLFFLFWIAYSVLRFNLEFFRGDDDRGWIGPLSTGQFMSIVMIIASLVALFSMDKKTEGSLRRDSILLHPEPDRKIEI